jgi:hypothetical protein
MKKKKTQTALSSQPRVSLCVLLSSESTRRLMSQAAVSTFELELGLLLRFAPCNDHITPGICCFPRGGGVGASYLLGRLRLCMYLLSCTGTMFQSTLGTWGIRGPQIYFNGDSNLLIGLGRVGCDWLDRGVRTGTREHELRPKRLVFCCRTTGSSTAARTPHRTCCPHAFVSITVLRVSRSCELFPDGFYFQLLHLL